MIKCKTNRPDIECSMMVKNKCSMNSRCEKVIDRCGTCGNIFSDGYCNKVLVPRVKWLSLGGCPLDTNKIIKIEEKHKLNPIKASKKSRGK